MSGEVCTPNVIRRRANQPANQSGLTAALERDWNRARSGCGVLRRTSGIPGAGVSTQPSMLARGRAGWVAHILDGMDDPNSDELDTEPRGRCVCGEKVIIADAQSVTLPNGRPGWQGFCPECGSPLFAIRRKRRPPSS